MFQFAKKPQKVPEFLRSNIFLGGFFVLAVFGFLVFFFPFSQGFRQDLGFQKLGCTMKTTPKKIFFLPEKAVVARFARASLADTGREAKRAGGVLLVIY